MNIDVAQWAIIIGVVNGIIVLVRPIARLHQRIDLLEYISNDLRDDVDKILGVSGIRSNRKRRE